MRPPAYQYACRPSRRRGCERHVPTVFALGERVDTGAELLLRRTVEEVCSLRDSAGIDDRARWRAQTAIAVDRCKRVVQSISEASGASAHFQSDPLQRSLRDLNTLACHVVFDLDGTLEMYGRTLLGLDPGSPLV